MSKLPHSQGKATKLHRISDDYSTKSLNVSRSDAIGEFRVPIVLHQTFPASIIMQQRSCDHQIGEVVGKACCISFVSNTDAFSHQDTTRNTARFTKE